MGISVALHALNILVLVVLVVPDTVLVELMPSEAAPARLARVRLQVVGVETQAAAVLAYHSCP